MTLDDIEREIRRLATLIDAPEQTLPSYGRTMDFARPHIEQHGKTLAWVVVERGDELERRETTSLDQLLYWVFEAVTFSMACHWELQHRRDDEDFRILMWTKQFELLSALNPKWVDQLKAELGDRLREVGPM